MIKSMTGYGKSVCQINGQTLTFEIKSLNSKSLDLYLKMPQILRENENQIRNILTEKLVRGKIELYVSLENNESVSNFSINKDLFKQYYHSIKSTADEINAPIGEYIINAIIKMPDVLTTQSEELNPDHWEIIIKTLNQTIDHLIEYRTSEGDHLKMDVEGCIKKISGLLTQIPQYESERLESIKQRITNSLNSIKDNIQTDPNRFEQELIYYIEKLDINEEKVRLEKHLEYFMDTISNEDNCGKKLGFISQEIGREINTIGSKAQHVEIQKIVVQMKDELEKIKEQLMNVI